MDRVAYGGVSPSHRRPYQFCFTQSNPSFLLQDEHGIGIDVSLACFDFEERVLLRASEWGPNKREQVRLCSAEDVVVLKAFADRPQDWIDIKNVVIRQAEKLNRELIMRELTILVTLKEEPEILGRLTKIFESFPS